MQPIDLLTTSELTKLFLPLLTCYATTTTGFEDKRGLFDLRLRKDDLTTELTMTEANYDRETTTTPPTRYHRLVTLRESVVLLRSNNRQACILKYYS